MKKLPKVIYAYYYDGGNESWLNTLETLEECAFPDEKRLVGVYELKETVEVSLEVKTQLVTNKKE